VKKIKNLLRHLTIILIAFLFYTTSFLSAFRTVIWGSGGVCDVMINNKKYCSKFSEVLVSVNGKCGNLLFHRRKLPHTKNKLREI
ncbi:Molecular chaperone, DnaJ family protein, partial [Giardia duodenalis]